MIRGATAILAGCTAIAWGRVALQLLEVDPTWGSSWTPALLSASLLAGGIWIALRSGTAPSTWLSGWAIISACYAIAVAKLGYAWIDLIFVGFGIVAPIALIVEQGMNKLRPTQR